MEPTEIEVRIEYANGRHIHVKGTPEEVAQALDKHDVTWSMLTPAEEPESPRPRRKAQAPPETKAVEPAEDK